MPADHLEAGAPLLILAPGQMAFTQPRMAPTMGWYPEESQGTLYRLTQEQYSPMTRTTTTDPTSQFQPKRISALSRYNGHKLFLLPASLPRLPNCNTKYAPAVTGIVHPDGGITRFAEPRWADSELRLQSEQQFAEDDPEMTLREADGIIEDQSQLITEQQTKIEDLERRNRELKSQVETLTAALQQWREFTQSYTGTALSSELPLHTADSTVLDQTQLEAYSANDTTTIPPHVITDAMGDGQPRYVQQYQNVTEAEDHSDTTHSSATMTRGLSSNGEPKGKGRAQ
ncbi:hypothetical protein I317_02542 [Kwoniella heveanensis CBS 569]|nr:hypothetical protein I317_02542 [Kwoniella heveanensis CBS 569]